MNFKFFNDETSICFKNIVNNQKFIGYADIDILLCPEIKPYGSYVESRTIKIFPTAHKVTLIKGSDYCQHYGYTNFRITNAKHVKIIALILGNHIIDECWPNILNMTHPFLTTNTNILPVIQWLGYYIYSQSDEEFELTYDVVKIENWDCYFHTQNYNKIEQYKCLYNFVVTQIQYSGEHIIYENKAEIKIDFNHPVTKIVMYAEKPVSASILLNDKIFIDMKYNDECYECNFVPSENFSRIDKQIITLTNNSGCNVIHIFGYNKNILICQDTSFGYGFKYLN